MAIDLAHGRKTDAALRSPTSIVIVSLVICAATLLIAIFMGILLVDIVNETTIPFDTDEANHAVDGWEVYWATSRGSLQNLYQALTAQAFYPPLHSTAVALSYWLIGPSLTSSRLPSVLIFAVSLILLAWLTYRVSRRIVSEGTLRPWLPLIGAAFSVLFALMSQIYASLAVLVMLEMTGAMVGLLFLLCVDAVDQAGQNRKRWAWLSISVLLAIAILLTKYSFALFFIPGLIAGILSDQLPWRLPNLRWREAAMLLLAIGGLIGLWVMVTDRATMMLFFTDHPEYVSRLSAENLLYLPQVWFRDYAVAPVFGAIVLGLAIWGTVHQWHWLTVRVATWSIIAGLIVLTISTTNESRHLLPLAPAIWMLAGTGLVTVLCNLRGRSSALIGAIPLTLFVLLLLSAVGPLRSLRGQIEAEFEGDPVYSEVQAFALGHVDLNHPVLFIGDFTDQNGLLALRWLAATSTGRSLDSIDLDYFPFENHEHSLIRTNRKPQIATVDPTFPRRYINEILDREHYSAVVEIKRLDNHFGPRGANPADPLCSYQTLEQTFGEWIVIVYDLETTTQADCDG
jgi:4-amino-4-deoxy-L-arabinose transferase-like glycosyltransferase